MLPLRIPAHGTEERGHSLETLLHLVNRLQLGKEPLVDVRHLPDLVNRVAPVERRRDREDALVSGILELLIDVLNEVVLTVRY